MFDLTEVKPNEFIRYGLGCLEVLAAQGDDCAREIRERMRIVVLSFLLGFCLLLQSNSLVMFNHSYITGCRWRWNRWLGSRMSR